MYINSFEGEEEELDYILDLTKRWKNATLIEFDNIEEIVECDKCCAGYQGYSDSRCAQH